MLEKIRQCYEEELKRFDKELEAKSDWTTNNELAHTTLQRMLAVFDFAVNQCGEHYLEVEDIFDEYNVAVMSRI